MTHCGIRTTGLRALLVTGILLITAACSSGGSGATAASGTRVPAGTAGASSGQSATTTVTVTEKEFSLQLSQTGFTPGKYTFVAKNEGTIPHSLAISGPGVQTTVGREIAPGSSAQLTVLLRSGTYELWCPIDGHKGMGMDTHIQVSPGPAPSANPAPSQPAPSQTGGYGNPGY